MEVKESSNQTQNENKGCWFGKHYDKSLPVFLRSYFMFKCVRKFDKTISINEDYHPYLGITPDDLSSVCKRCNHHLINIMKNEFHKLDAIFNNGKYIKKIIH